LIKNQIGTKEWMSKFNSQLDFYDWVAAICGVADLDGARDGAKQLVFQSIYGGVSSEMQELPFFNEVHLLALKYKADLDRNGFVLTPLNHIPITKEKFGEDIPGDITETEMFNHARKEIIKSFNGENIGGLYLMESLHNIAIRVKNFLLTNDLVEDVYCSDEELIDFIIDKLRTFAPKRN
jgi:hypothetical protein